MSYSIFKDQFYRAGDGLLSRHAPSTSSISDSSVSRITSFNSSFRKSQFSCKRPFTSGKLTVDFDLTMAPSVEEVIFIGLINTCHGLFFFAEPSAHYQKRLVECFREMCRFGALCR